MKKLVFLFAMVFTSVMVFGQQSNYTSVIQNGNANTAEVLSQVSTNGPNYLYFWQNGNNNSLTAEQTFVDDGSVNGLNFSQGEQNGASNFAKVTQDGYLNRSYLTQSGDYNQMELTQFKSGVASVDVDNYAENNQIGNFNDYKLGQDGHLNVQNLWQTGNNNEAWINQTAILSENYSYVYQNGDKNMVDLNQKAVNNNFGAINSSIAQQNGFDNMFKITQVGEFAENTSDLIQAGDYNDTYLYQSTWYHNTSTNKVTGAGDHNYLKVSQAQWEGGVTPF